MTSSPTGQTDQRGIPVVEEEKSSEDAKEMADNAIDGESAEDTLPAEVDED